MHMPFCDWRTQAAPRATNNLRSFPPSFSSSTSTAPYFFTAKIKRIRKVSPALPLSEVAILFLHDIKGLSECICDHCNGLRYQQMDSTAHYSFPG